MRAHEPARPASARHEGSSAKQTGSRTGNGSLARARPRSGAASFARRDPAPAGSCPARADRSRPRARQRSRGCEWASAHPRPGQRRRSQDRRSEGAARGLALRRGADGRTPERVARGADGTSRRQRTGFGPRAAQGTAFGVQWTGAGGQPPPPRAALRCRRGWRKVTCVARGSGRQRQSSERVSARAPLRSSRPGSHGCHAGRCPARARFGVFERGTRRRVAVKVGGETAPGKGLRSPDGKRPRHQGSRKGPGATGACPRTLHLREEREAVTARRTTSTVRRQRWRQRASSGSRAANGGPVEAHGLAQGTRFVPERASARPGRTSPARRPKVWWSNAEATRARSGTPRGAGDPPPGTTDDVQTAPTEETALRRGRDGRRRRRHHPTARLPLGYRAPGFGQENDARKSHRGQRGALQAPPANAALRCGVRGRRLARRPRVRHWVPVMPPSRRLAADRQHRPRRPGFTTGAKERPARDRLVRSSAGAASGASPDGSAVTPGATTGFGPRGAPGKRRRGHADCCDGWRKPPSPCSGAASRGGRHRRIARRLRWPRPGQPRASARGRSARRRRRSQDRRRAGRSSHATALRRGDARRATGEEPPDGSKAEQRLQAGSPAGSPRYRPRGRANRRLGRRRRPTPCSSRPRRSDGSRASPDGSTARSPADQGLARGRQESAPPRSFGPASRRHLPPIVLRRGGHGGDTRREGFPTVRQRAAHARGLRPGRLQRWTDEVAWTGATGPPPPASCSGTARAEAAPARRWTVRRPAGRRERASARERCQVRRARSQTGA